MVCNQPSSDAGHNSRVCPHFSAFPAGLTKWAVCGLREISVGPGLSSSDRSEEIAFFSSDFCSLECALSADSSLRDVLCLGPAVSLTIPSLASPSKFCFSSRSETMAAAPFSLLPGRGCWWSCPLFPLPLPRLPLPFDFFGIFTTMKYVLYAV